MGTANWLPGKRDDVMVMAKNWLALTAANSAAWKIPAEVSTDLPLLISKAETALNDCKNAETRTPVATAKCKTAFENLEAFMRDMKKRYFYEPPLTDADIIALGLRLPDHTHTPAGAPTAQVTAETFLVGRRELGLRIVYLIGSPDDKANKGYRVYYRVVAAGETPPASPEELTKSFFTHRKKDVIEFDYGDSGKTAYFAIQIENDGKKGPWGPLANAVIP
jgi:hypothetical protein